MNARMLKNAMWNFSDYILEMLASATVTSKHPHQGRHFVVLTPSKVGNLGDEAMITSVVTRLRDYEPAALITLITHDPSDAVYFSSIGVNTVCLQGYFSRVPSLSALSRLNSLLKRATDFILLGADILDGCYSRTRSFRRLLLARQAERFGCNVFVLGFSFSDKAIPPIKKYMRRQCRTFTYVCRDPHSADRVGKVVGKAVPYGADLAFLLPTPDAAITEACARADDVLRTWRDAKLKVIAVNVNPLGIASAHPGIDMEAAVSTIAAALSSVKARNNCALLLLTHDNRSGNSDAALMSKILHRMEKDDLIHFVPETMRAADVKYLCKRVDLTVTARMHLGIASLGAGTATMILDFQGKVRGLLKLFDLEYMAIDVRDFVCADRLASRVTEQLLVHDRTSARVQEKLESIHNLSMKNIQVIFGENTV